MIINHKIKFINFYNSLTIFYFCTNITVKSEPIYRRLVLKYSQKRNNTLKDLQETCDVYNKHYIC